MKGYAMLKIGESGWIEKERPVCGPLDAICRPIAVAICSSDVHTLWSGAIGERHNMILGHECCAEVVEVGSLVKDFKPGDRVLVPAITPDWSSAAAQAGWQQHSGGMLGGWKFSNYKDGVFADFFHVNDADGNLAHLPEGMDPVDACIMSDMVPTGFHAVEQADVQFGDTVLVIGIGPVDRVCIAGGNVDTFSEAIKCLKPGGRIGNVNYLGSGDYVKIPRVEWGAGMSNKTISGGLMPGGRLRMEKLASLVTSGRLDLHKEVTHVFEGMDHVEEALFMMRDKPRDLIKPVVIWK